MKRLVLRTVLPALLAIGLFSGVVYFSFLPSLRDAVMDQKRLMIRELTESAWNILARFEADEQAGRMTRDEAQRGAIEQVRSLHYGQGGKDYFWINTMHPRMIVHPYRPDLEGRDLSNFADPDGKLMFAEMVRLVERDGAGYVSYSWQWKDDPERIVPKLSYVKGFEPWGWILGTGVYTDDVEREVGRVTGRLQAAALAILAVVSLLLAVLLRTSFQAERGRLSAATALRRSEEKYRLLVESAGEAIFMSLGGEGLYANASLLRLTGYERDEFARLDPDSVVRPTAREAESGRRRWQEVMDGTSPPTRYETELVARDGSTVRVLLTISRLDVQGQVGFMAVATRLARPRELDLLTAEDATDLAAANRRLATTAALMISHGEEPVGVCRMLSDNADAAVRRAVELAVAELGPAPTAFDVMLMGSLGRAEVSLLADQDHALVFANEGPDADAHRSYFLALGGRLSRTLEAAGYARCPGGVMAGERACCRSLAEWRTTFSGWIGAQSADDLLRAKIFFDFRSALNEGRLVEELQEHLRREAPGQPRFLHLLARSILQYEPPLGAFGGFALEGGGGEDTFDVKGVMAQIVDYVRLRALQHGVVVAGTRARLAALAANGRLGDETARDLDSGFDFLLGLRLRRQAERLLNRLEPDNRLAPAALTELERRRLKEVFGHLKALQSALDHEFKGG